MFCYFEILFLFYNFYQYKFAEFFFFLELKPEL